MRSLVVSEEAQFVEAVHRWVNTELLVKEEAAMKKHGLSLPISMPAVHYWIHKIPITG